MICLTRSEVADDITLAVSNATRDSGPKFVTLRNENVNINVPLYEPCRGCDRIDIFCFLGELEETFFRRLSCSEFFWMKKSDEEKFLEENTKHFTYRYICLLYL